MKLKIILHNVQSTAFFEQMLTVLDLELGIYSAEKLVLSIKSIPIGTRDYRKPAPSRLRIVLLQNAIRDLTSG